MKTNEMCLVNVPTVVAVCCVLHDVYEVHGESLNERWIEDCSDNSRELLLPLQRRQMISEVLLLHIVTTISLCEVCNVVHLNTV